MPSIKRLIDLHDECAKDHGIAAILGDPFLIANVGPYAKIRHALSRNPFITTVESSDSKGFGSTIYRLLLSNLDEPIEYFNNSQALLEVLQNAKNQNSFTVDSYDFKDILGNTLIAEYLQRETISFLKTTAKKLSPEQTTLVAFISSFVIEMWIALHCSTKISRWFCALNLHFRQLSHLSEIYPDLTKDTRLDDFLDLHLFEITKAIFYDLDGSRRHRGEISEPTITALNLAGSTIYQVARLLFAPSESNVDIKTSLEEIISVLDSSDFRDYMGRFA